MRTKNYYCPFCGNGYVSLSLLFKHKRKSHVGERLGDLKAWAKPKEKKDVFVFKPKLLTDL